MKRFKFERDIILIGSSNSMHYFSHSPNELANQVVYCHFEYRKTTCKTPFDEKKIISNQIKSNQLHK